MVKEGPEQIKVSRSEQLWVADITYLPTSGKFAYLSLVTDAHSRKIVGWHVHESLQTEEVAQAMKMALRGRQTDQRLVHHSDRGIQGEFNPSSQHGLKGDRDGQTYTSFGPGWACEDQVARAASGTASLGETAVLAGDR